MATPRWRMSLATIWLLLPLVGVIVAATLEPVPPHDYWWPLAMGRLIDGGQLPDANLFLYTLPRDLPFVNQPWLGQWLMWQAYEAAGHAGGVWLRNGLLGAAFLLILGAAFARSRDARAVGALGLLAAIVAYPVLTVRTQMFAFLPYALVVWACFGVSEGRLRRRWLMVVPVAVAWWANVHGSFVLGAAVVFAVGLGTVVEEGLSTRTLPRRTLREWGLTLVAAVGAGALSPLGGGVYAYVVQLTMESSVAHSVTEWLPPDVTELRGQIFLGAFVSSLVLLFIRRREVKLSEVFLYAGTFLLAASAVRNVFWWATCLPVVLAPHLCALLPRAAAEEVVGRGERIGLWLGAGLLLGAMLVVQPGLGRVWVGELSGTQMARQQGEGAYILNHENALVTVDRALADGRVRLFHDQVVGGLLEVRATGRTPAQVAFVDQRMEFIPDEVWARYFALSRAMPNWQRELDRLGVDTLLLSPQSQWPLLQAALASPRWELVALDQSHVLLYAVQAPSDSLDRGQDPAE